MSCVGYRAWAWKRLLVKCIFFDAWTKVMTRAMSLLALYMPLNYLCCTQDDQQPPLDPEFKDTFKTLKTMMNSTNNALGDMQFTQGKLGPLVDNSNLRPKTFQALLTIHKKKCQKWVTEGNEELRSDDLKKLNRLDIQLKWLKYLDDKWDTLKNIPTTRFLKLDPGVYLFFKDRAKNLEEENIHFQRQTL